MMRKFFDTIAWFSLFAFFVPTTLVIASWNSLPGETIYPVKLGMERALLVLASPSYAATGQLHLKYTERRFSEAQKLLSDKHSVEGLTYLTQQVETAKVAIEKASDPREERVLTKEYIATLTQVSYQLEQQKQAIASTALAPPGQRTSGYGPTNLPLPLPTEEAGPILPLPGTRAPTSAPPNLTGVPIPPTAKKMTEAPPPSPTASVTTTTPVPAQTAVVALQITHTQEKIDETIKELEEHQKENEKKEKENKENQGKKDQN